ncbi:MAG: hypothetical protein EHM15_08700 [Desulfobacteraceae bacterium]|nr:MAG: hypothetical protein EHM15_08700 [Desulfobacteraceae bacterium]
MLNVDKLLKIQGIINEILTFEKNADFKDDNQLSVKIFQMLDMLVHMQSINISIRAELIDKLFSMRPNLRDEILDQAINGEDNIILFDRRKAHPERREFQGDLISDRRSNPIPDRRSGIPDRRRGTGL